MEELEQRQKQAVESILDNESLTANLDDQVAGALLGWTTGLARSVVQQAAALGSDEAETLIEERLSAVRGLMRQVNRWAAGGTEMSREESAEWLETVLQKLSAIQGAQAPLLDDTRRQAFLETHAHATPAEMVALLQTLITDQRTPEPPPQEKKLSWWQRIFGQ